MCITKGIDFSSDAAAKVWYIFYQNEGQDLIHSLYEERDIEIWYKLHANLYLHDFLKFYSYYLWTL